MKIITGLILLKEEPDLFNVHFGSLSQEIVDVIDAKIGNLRVEKGGDNLVVQFGNSYKVKLPSVNANFPPKLLYGGVCNIVTIAWVELIKAVPYYKFNFSYNDLVVVTSDAFSGNSVSVTMSMRDMIDCIMHTLSDYTINEESSYYLTECKIGAEGLLESLTHYSSESNNDTLARGQLLRSAISRFEKQMRSGKIPTSDEVIFNTYEYLIKYRVILDGIEKVIKDRASEIFDKLSDLEYVFIFWRHDDSDEGPYRLSKSTVTLRVDRELNMELIVHQGEVKYGIDILDIIYEYVYIRQANITCALVNG